jgi:predicted  nucleic acid-binding Zn-ribbon protein
MAASLNEVLREVHRLRRHLSELHTEVERLPRTLKAHAAKVAKQEQTLKDAVDNLRKLKVANADRELRAKTTHQQLLKFEKQMSDMKSPKEIDGKQKEIAAAKATIAALEAEVLVGITEIEEKTAEIPALEKAVKKAKSDFANFEVESLEHKERLEGEKTLALSELKVVEAQMPADIASTYSRLVKAHGHDALAEVRERERSCGQCLNAVTVQNINELLRGRLMCCNNCGRILYIERQQVAVGVES